MNALQALAFAKAEERSVVLGGTQCPSTTTGERTEMNGVVTYRFESLHTPTPFDVSNYFEIGQVVVFADNTPEAVKEEFGRFLVVVDDDTDLIVQVEIQPNKKNGGAASVPQSDEELYVTCYSLSKPVQRLQVSREVLVRTDTQLSLTVVNDLLIEWTGRGLVGNLKPHCPSPELTVVAQQQL